MNLNYEKIKAKVEHGGNQWTGYSDLFLVLSVVFLLLYVVANLRSGTTSVASITQVRALKNEVEDLRKQIKTYDVLRDDYLNKGATKDEVEVYQELIGKLDLLESDAKKESKELAAKSAAASEKERQLNKYQALVKNIISANLVAQGRVKKREEVIEEQGANIAENRQVIAEKNKDITDLNKTVAQREAVINENNQQIAAINTKLERQIADAKAAWKSKYKSEQALNAAIAKMREDSSQQIQGLQAQNNQIASQLESTREQLSQKTQEGQQLVAQLSNKETQVRAAMEKLKQERDESAIREKIAFENGINNERLSGEAKLAKERAYRATVERKNQAFNDKINALGEQLAKTRGEITAVEGKYQGKLAEAQKGFQQQLGQQANQFQGQIASLQKDKQVLAGQAAGLSKELAGAQAKLNNMRNLAKSMKENFDKAGISADVDMRTGDVLIQFKDDYFDTGRADLKSTMRSTLERLMPVYARSLLEDPKVASKVTSVEIVGFASPTYKGKYVNPETMSQADRQAVNFNMDLSYQRAKSIFSYVFDPQKMSFPHQKALLPMVKVSGRSFLATDKQAGRELSSVKDGNYCAVYDCKKSQRVIIKFNLKDE